ncbi:FAD-dependent oxidoreductase [Bacillus bombysepticus]|uniref:FAD-dependent oxidoreductase n=1 Tax=Bacillus bombysepticus TaxID=658666 RepID=UPI00301A6DD2
MKKIFAIGMVCLLCACQQSNVEVATKQKMQKVEKEKKPVVTYEDYDVVVAGGQPEGVSAAVSAARNGTKVLILEKRNNLGGLITFGYLNFLDFPRNKDGVIVSKGIFKEWHRLAGNGQPVTVDIDKAQNAFQTLVTNEANITTMYNTKITKPIFDSKEKNNLVAVEAELKDGRKVTYRAKRFIDATEDGDLAQISHVPSTVGQEDIGRNDKMAVTLVMHFKNVDWNGVIETAKSRKFGYANYNDNAAWGFGGMPQAYPEIRNDTNVRGLNIGRTSNGDIYINALQIFNIDGTKEEDKKKAIKFGTEEMTNFLSWAKVNFPGFQQAEIASIPSELYIRETRHFSTEYQLSLEDIWKNANHWDDIAIGSYPSDVQALNKENSGAVVAKPDQYGIPYRTMVPKTTNNLLITSKAGGYRSLAAGSARIIPTGMSVAEAGGVAASISIKEGIGFREMIAREDLVKRIQEQIVAQGGYLQPRENVTYPYQNDPILPHLMFLNENGLIIGGYTNNFLLEQPMKEQQFLNLIINGAKQLNKEWYKKNSEHLHELAVTSADQALTMNYVLRFQPLFQTPVPHYTGVLLKRNGFEIAANWLQGIQTQNK